MFWSSQNSFCETQYIKKIDSVPKNMQVKYLNTFSEERTKDSLNWRDTQKIIHEKIAEIQSQKKILINISKKIKNNSFICGQDSNLPLIVSEISIEIKQSLNEIVERISNLQQKIQSNMSEILNSLNSNSLSSTYEMTKINVPYLSNKNLNKQILLLDKSQGIQKIKQKISQLEKQLIQTKENERKLTFMIKNLSQSEKNASKQFTKVQNTIKRNLSQFKNSNKSQIKNHNYNMNPESYEIQKPLYINKALKFKNTLSNAKNIKQENINILPQNEMRFLDQLVISQSQSINSSQTLIKNNQYAPKLQNQKNEIDQKTLRKVFDSKQKIQRTRNIQQNRYQSQIKDFKRNKSQSSFQIQPKKYSIKQVKHQVPNFLNNIGSNSLQNQSKNSVKNSNNFLQFGKNQIGFDNKIHRQAFLMSNLIN